MAYCGPRGIPLSTFLGWPAGDQDAAMAWQAGESRHCRSCGSHPDTWDPEAGGHRDAMYAETYRCRGCELLEQARDTAEKQKDQLGKGTHQRLLPTPTVGG